MDADEQATAAAKARAEADQQATKLTCDVLCSLSSACCMEPTPSNAAVNVHPAVAAPAVTNAAAGPHMEYHPIHRSWETTNGNSPTLMSTTTSVMDINNNERKAKPCPKQHQLPMFLSKTYHMIDRCNADIATWGEAGDSFVVKNVDKFSSEVLPLYFKHSNFSSFARQLNFYGFRKLRSDPILTSDVDPQTANYIRFYHSKFQKDRPDLLHQIKRATKSEQQSKDDVDGLKAEVCKLKDCVQQMSIDMERKMAEMSYEYNRRIANLSGEYDKLANLVTQLLHHHHHHYQQHAAGGAPPLLPPPPVILHSAAPPAHHPVPRAAVPTYVTTVASHASTNAPVSSFVSLAAAVPPQGATHHPAVPALPPTPACALGPEMMGSLSHGMATRLEQQQQQQTQAEHPTAQASSVALASIAETAKAGEKRPAPERDSAEDVAPYTKLKVDDSN